MKRNRKIQIRTSSKTVKYHNLTSSIFREEPKQESDLDDPWIMTVKGNHSIKLPQEDLTPNHKITNKIQNGSGPTIAKSPPKDSNLNHYRPDKATPVSTSSRRRHRTRLKSLVFPSPRGRSPWCSRPPTTETGKKTPTRKTEGRGFRAN